MESGVCSHSGGLESAVWGHSGVWILESGVTLGSGVCSHFGVWILESGVTLED